MDKPEIIEKINTTVGGHIRVRNLTQAEDGTWTGEASPNGGTVWYPVTASEADVVFDWHNPVDASE